jgi:hypothetical protein
MNIRLNLQNTTDRLLSIANDICFNTISHKVLYFMRGFDNYNQKSSLYEYERENYKLFSERNFLSMEELVRKIEKHKKFLTWVDLTLYFSSEEETIILVELVFTKRRFIFWHKFSSKLNFHCGIRLPDDYTVKNNQKFDVNWHLQEFLSSK